RRTESVPGEVQEGDEYSAAFSPDGTRLAARVDYSKGDPLRQKPLIIWDVATGKRVAGFRLAPEFAGSRPLVWWGGKHAVLLHGPGRGLLSSLADGQVVRECFAGSQRRFSPRSPDGRL